MKSITKSFLQAFTLILFISGAIAFSSCNNSNKHNSESGTADSTGHNGAHRYACPMHPDVEGKEDDKCPKCGMDLEHQDAPQSNKSYFMQFNTSPAEAEADKDVTLSFTPKIQGEQSEQVPLDVEHEKKIHLICVSSDLSWFDHIHPTYQSDGSYQIKCLSKDKGFTNGRGLDETKFDNGGAYIFFADYKPTGGDHTVDKIELTVKGKSAAEKKFTTQKLSSTADGYEFILQPTGDRFVSGVLMHITGVVKKNGKEMDASTLENYLGAKAHMVVIGLEDKNYLHVHPEVSNGKFDLHTTFDKEGIYRAWIQFQAEGKVHTADFVIKVAKGTEADAKAMNDAHAAHHLHEQEEVKAMKGMEVHKH